MTISVEELSRVPLFDGMPRRHLVRVARMIEMRDVPKGEELVREGNFTREFFMLFSGTAVESVRGRKIDTIGARDFFGELALLNKSARSATITATSRLRVGVLNARDFQAVLESEPKMALHMLVALARRSERLVRQPAGKLR